MVVRIVLWSLADSKTTIEELRRYLRDEAVDEFAEVEGLRFKAWISDPLGERWGAFYLFESREEADQVLPTGVRDLIGKDPEVVEEFDLEASIEGRFVDARALAARPRVRVAELLDDERVAAEQLSVLRLRAGPAGAPDVPVVAGPARAAAACRRSARSCRCGTSASSARRSAPSPCSGRAGRCRRSLP